MSSAREVSVSTRIGNWTLDFESGALARQADGAVIACQGDTVVLATVVSSPKARDDIGFFPLTVDYREKMAATGRIPGGYLKREGRITDREILGSRLIDRTLRPLFPDGYRNETQILATLLSYEPGTDPQVIAINAASCALFCSDIPWRGPAAAVRVVLGENGFVAFPNTEERSAARLEFVVSFTSSGLVMVEGKATEVGEDEVLAALEFAEAQGSSLLELMERMRAQSDKEKREWEPISSSPGLVQQVAKLVEERISSGLTAEDKRTRSRLLRSITEETIETMAETATAEMVSQAVVELTKKLIRKKVLSGSGRMDGRSPVEVRPIHCKVGWLPRAHGSSLFTRGETQAAVTCTLGAGRDELEAETPDGACRKRFFLHYNFPPYSVGETRPLRGPGRREIGHGNLASMALEPVLPTAALFPYTIRIESEITESNGSSSMATVCGGTLALMDAGVPIRSPVAGVAMGLVADAEQALILTDILGDEDHAGDMDFKVAGTAQGVTAVQMDNKLGALPRDLLSQAFAQAKEARFEILEKMAISLASPRPHLGEHVPRVERMKIRPNRIRELIGPGGRIIQELQKSTGARVEVKDSGLVTVYAGDAAMLSAAKRRIKELTSHAEVGKAYSGTVAKAIDAGFFVRLFGSIEGFLPAHECGGTRPSEGSTLVVLVTGVDGRGRIQLTMPEPESLDTADIVRF